MTDNAPDVVEILRTDLDGRCTLIAASSGYLPFRYKGRRGEQSDITYTHIIYTVMIIYNIDI
jgi:hypothetical protein